MTHLFHEITAWSYFVVAPILFACGTSARFRFTLLNGEAERAATFKLVAVFVWACFVDHYADAVRSDYETLVLTSAIEAIVSAFTAAFLLFRVVSRWRQWRG